MKTINKCNTKPRETKTLFRSPFMQSGQEIDWGYSTAAGASTDPLVHRLISSHTCTTVSSSSMPMCYTDVYASHRHQLITCKQLHCYRHHYHRLRGSASTVLTATGHVNGRWWILTPHRIETHEPFFSETRVQVRPVDGFLRAIAH